MYISKLAEVSAFQRYMTVRLNCATKTAEGYARDLDRFAAFIAPRPLQKAKAKHITRWTDGLMEDGSNQPQSIHRKIAALTAFYKWSIREGLRKKNPMAEVDRPKIGKRLPMCMTEDEVRKLLAVTSQQEGFYGTRAHAMMQLMYGSGLRRSEVTNVNVGHLDLEHGMLRVIGKGDKERVVFLSVDGAEALRAWMRFRPASAQSDAMFTKQNGKRLSARQLWVIFRETVSDSGITRRVVPHTMRHSFATHMIQGGADIMSVKELLGHCTVATTQVYCNVSLRHIREAFDKSHPGAKPGAFSSRSDENEQVSDLRCPDGTDWKPGGG